MLGKINPGTRMFLVIFYASSDTAATWSHGGGHISAENTLDG